MVVRHCKVRQISLVFCKWYSVYSNRSTWFWLYTGSIKKCSSKFGVLWDAHYLIIGGERCSFSAFEYHRFYKFLKSANTDKKIAYFHREEFIDNVRKFTPILELKWRTFWSVGSLTNKPISRFVYNC